MKKLFTLAALLVGFGLIFGGAVPLGAEETDDEEFTLEEITVTAQKREESQQKVPIAMEIISGEEIGELGKTELDSILSYISSAIIQRATDGLRVSIRGLSDDSSAFRGQSMATPTVAINTDGVMTNRKDTGAGLFDVERVEVLFGPQSTLYASNSPGGIVNIVTNNPSTERYELSGTLEYGSYNLLHTEGAVNVPVASTLALRTSFSTQKRDGYLDNGTDDQDSKAVRVRALYEPTENLSITATAQLTESGSSGRTGGVVIFENQDDVDDPWTAVASSSSGGNNDRNNESYSAEIDWQTKAGALTVVPSYSTGEAESTSVQVMNGIESTIVGEQDSEEKGVEVRMSSNADFFFKWIVGFNYYNSEDTNFRDTLDSEIWSNRTIKEDAYAAFANITYPVTEQFRFTVGYRRSWDDFTSINQEVTWQGQGALRHTVLMDQNILMEYSSPDYKVGVEYDLGDNAMLYADYSTSYRVRGMSQQNTRDPEELKAYSLGAKSRLFDNKFQMNASAYYYDYSNYGANQRVLVTFDEDGDGELDSSQADPNSATDGDGRMIGIDLQTSTVITPQDILSLSVSWEDSEWTDLYFDYYYDYTEVVDEETGEIIQEPIEDADYNGKPMTNTPPWTISTNYTHNFLLPNGGNIKASLNARYQTSYYLSWKDADAANSYQESYRMEDFSLTYNHPPGNISWSLSAYVRNIENYAVKRGYFGAGGQGQLTIGEPRTYGAVLSVKY